MIVYCLMEDLIFENEEWMAGEIISQSTLERMMTVYVEISVKVITIQ